MNNSASSGSASRLSPLFRVAWVVYLLVALAGAAWLMLDSSDKNPCGDTKLCLALIVHPQRWPADLALGIGAALGLLGIWEVLRRKVAIARQMEETLAGRIGPVGTDEAWGIALLSGFAEELFFRGAAQPSLGWPLATVLFALMHTGPGKELRFWTLYAAVGGLTLAGLMEWRGSLLAPMVAHVLVNAVSLGRLARRTAPKTDDKENGTE